MIRQVYKSYSGEKLVSLISGGDDGMAFDELFGRYWEGMVGTAYNILSDKETSCDLVQDVFVSLWKRRHLVKIDNVQSYLFGAVRMKVFEHLRKTKIRREHVDRMSFIVSVSDADHRVINGELKQRIKESLAKVPERSREVFQLSRFEGKSNAQIAEYLNISIKTVEGHLTRALGQLRHDLEGIMALIALLGIS